VQFHPEFDADITRAYLEARRDVVDEEMGEGETDRRLAEVKEAPLAAALLPRFADFAVRTRVGMSIPPGVPYGG
jgi:GMP synthase (glutamine-hydrolysing)